MSSRFRKRLKQSSSSLTGVSKNEHPVSFEIASGNCHEPTLVDDHEVWVTVLVDFTDSTEQEANASVLKNQNNYLQKFYFYFEEDGERTAPDNSPHHR